MKFIFYTFICSFFILNTSAWANDGKKDYSFFIKLEYLSTPSTNTAEFESVRVPFINPTRVFHQYRNSYGQNIENIFQLNQEERSNLIERLITKSYSHSKTLSDEEKILKNNALSVLEFAESNSDSEANDFLKNSMRDKSFGEKVNFLANILSYTSSNYDFEMLEDDYQEEFVSDMDMLSAIKYSIETGEKMPAGVCRHMHQFGVRVATQMGLKNAFGVGFRTNGGGHRTMVFDVPGKENEVIQLNYGTKIHMNKVDGTQALAQNHSIPDSGFKYNIYNGRDQAAINLPSEQGAVLNRVTGGADKDLIYNFQTQSEINQVGVNTPYGMLRFFNSKLRIGSQINIKGLSYNKSFKFFKLFSTDIGLAGFSSGRTLNSGDLFEVKGFYGRSTTQFNWKFYTSPNLSLSTFSKVHMKASFYCSAQSDGKCTKNQEFSFDNQTGISANYTRGKFSNTLNLMAHTQMANKHASFTVDQTLIVPAMTISNQLEINYNNNFSSKHLLSLTRYDLGTGVYNVLNTENSIHSNKYSVNVYQRYQGAVDNNTPTWLPGAQKKSTYGLSKSFMSNKLKLSTRYTINESISDNNFGINIDLEL